METHTFGGPTICMQEVRFNSSPSVKLGVLSRHKFVKSSQPSPDLVCTASHGGSPNIALVRFEAFWATWLPLLNNSTLPQPPLAVRVTVPGLLEIRRMPAQHTAESGPRTIQAEA